MKKTDIIASIMELYNSAVNAWENLCNTVDEDVAFNYRHPVTMVRANKDITYGLRKDFDHTVMFDGKFKRLERYTNRDLIELESFLDWIPSFYASAEI